jgi:hypothetical protein
MRSLLVDAPTRSGSHIELAHEIRDNDINRISRIVMCEVRDGMTTI